MSSNFLMNYLAQGLFGSLKIKYLFAVSTLIQKGTWFDQSNFPLLLLVTSRGLDTHYESMNSIGSNSI